MMPSPILVLIILLITCGICQAADDGSTAFVSVDSTNMTAEWSRLLDGPNLTITLTFLAAKYGAIGLAENYMNGLIITCIPDAVSPSCLTYLGPPSNGALPLASTQLSSLRSSHVNATHAVMTFTVIATVWGVLEPFGQTQRVIFASGPILAPNAPQYHGKHRDALQLVLADPAPAAGSSSSGNGDDSEASQVVGWAATGITICYFSSTVQIILAVFKKKSARGLNVHNFAGMMLNCALWVMYGLRSKHAQVWATNGVGFLISLTGLIGFVIFAANGERGYNSAMLFGSLAVGAGGGGAIAFLLKLSLAKEIVGYLAMGANIFMYGAPLTLMAQMIRGQDVSTLSVVTIAAGQLTSATWLAYAFLIKNVYIGVPNGIGVALFLTQFALYFKFRHSEATVAAHARKAAGDEDDVERDPLVN